jgi:hypothetical protein
MLHATMNLKRVIDNATGLVGQHVDVDAMKGDLDRVREAVARPGSLETKAKAAREALKRPEATPESPAPPPDTTEQPDEQSPSMVDEGAPLAPASDDQRNRT